MCDNSEGFGPPTVKQEAIALRKSTPSPGSVNGNRDKYDSYKEAWARITQAQTDGYNLEAIALQESIIRDRLISYLARPKSRKPVTKDKKGRYPSLAVLINKLAAEFRTQQNAEDVNDLCASLHRWREGRNTAIHSFVVSDPGTPTVSVDNFLTDVQLFAVNGTELARMVCDWHRRQLRKES